jgi:biopolymer transport protein ExbD
MIHEATWGYYPHSVGLEVCTTKAKSLTLVPVDEEPLVLTLQPANSDSTSVETSLFLNSRPIPWTQLRNTLRAELSRRANRIIYIDGDQDLHYAEVVRLVDAAEGAWFGVSVVLLTPKLKEQTKYGCSRPLHRRSLR